MFYPNLTRSFPTRYHSVNELKEQFGSDHGFLLSAIGNDISLDRYWKDGSSTEVRSSYLTDQGGAFSGFLFEAKKALTEAYSFTRAILRKRGLNALEGRLLSSLEKQSVLLVEGVDLQH